MNNVSAIRPTSARTNSVRGTIRGESRMARQRENSRESHSVAIRAAVSNNGAMRANQIPGVSATRRQPGLVAVVTAVVTSGEVPSPRQSVPGPPRELHRRWHFPDQHAAFNLRDDGPKWSMAVTGPALGTIPYRNPEPHKNSQNDVSREDLHREILMNYAQMAFCTHPY